MTWVFFRRRLGHSRLTPKHTHTHKKWNFHPMLRFAWPVKTDKTSHSTLLSFGLIRARFSSNELQISGFRQLKQHSVFLSWWPWKGYSNKGWSGLSYESDLCVTFLINKIIFGNLVLSPVTPYTHILSSRRDVPPWDTIKMEPTGGCWAGGRVVRII